MPTDLILQAGVQSPPTPKQAASVAKPAHGGTAEVVGAANTTPAATGSDGKHSAHQGHSAELDAALSKISDYVQNVQRSLTFSVDKASGRTVIKVIDSANNEVIRQIPSEEVLDIAKRIAEMADKQSTGLLVQSKA